MTTRVRACVLALSLSVALVPLGIQAQGVTTFQALAVTSTAAGISTAVSNVPNFGAATECFGQVETAAVRYRLDGVVPTAAVGMPASPGDIIQLKNVQDIASFSVIAQTGSPVISFICRGNTTPAASTLIKAAPLTLSASTGQVLISQGTGAAPAYTAAPVVTSLGATGNLYLGGTGLAAGAGVDNYFTKTVTAIADNVATNVLTVTVPNAAHAAAIPVVLLTSIGAGGAIGAFECSGTAYGQIIVARTAGVATVATAVALSNAGSSCVAGATTITTSYAVTGMTGAVSATQTFNVTVTIARGTGSSTNHQTIVAVDMVNANAAGITIS